MKNYLTLFNSHNSQKTVDYSQLTMPIYIIDVNASEGSVQLNQTSDITTRVALTVAPTIEITEVLILINDH